MRSIVPIARLSMIDTADSQPQRVINLPHPNGVSSGKIIVNGHHMDALAEIALRYAGKVATKVLPSPVRISAILP